MKEENYLEGIYGCLERIEKKVEILSSAPADKNKAVTGGETGIAMLREIRDGLERNPDIVQPICRNTPRRQQKHAGRVRQEPVAGQNR